MYNDRVTTGRKAHLQDIHRDTGSKTGSSCWKMRRRIACLVLAGLILAGAGRQKVFAEMRQRICAETQREAIAEMRQKVCAGTQQKAGRETQQKVCAETQQKALAEMRQKICAGTQQKAGPDKQQKASPETQQKGSAETQQEAAASAFSKIAEQMISGVQKLASRAKEEAKALAEAGGQGGGYDFTLGFAGDICLADNYIPMQHLEAIGSEDISDGIDPRYIEIMQDMDLMWINNEFAYSLRGEPQPGKAWTFCGDPANVSYLKDLGVDIVGLANNHTFDFGEDAFLDTLSTLEEAGIPYVGAGRTLEQAQAPVYLEAGGSTIAYVAASCAEYTIYTPEATDTEPGILWCYDNARFLSSIRTAAENADFVIALPHWGVEHSTVLEEAQIQGAHDYIDAGADAVIGAHPHILQGIEYYKGKPILYSLGNFWFDGYDIDTLVAGLRVKGRKTDPDASDSDAIDSDAIDSDASDFDAPESKASESDASDSDVSDSDGSLEDAQVELVLYPGTQSGVYTGLADTPEWRNRILEYLEDISVNVRIDEDGVVHERK